MMILLDIFLVRLASSFLILFFFKPESHHKRALLSCFKYALAVSKHQFFEGLKSHLKLLQSQPGEGAKTLNKPFFLALLTLWEGSWAILARGPVWSQDFCEWIARGRDKSDWETKLHMESPGIKCWMTHGIRREESRKVNED